MRIDPHIVAAIAALPAAYELVSKKDHIFLQVPGHPRVCIRSRHPIEPLHRVAKAAATLRRLARSLSP